MKLIIGENILKVVSTYATKAGLDDIVKVTFLERLYTIFRKVSDKEHKMFPSLLPRPLSQKQGKEERAEEE